MYIGGGITLLVIGAILSFAVRDNISGVNLTVMSYDGHIDVGLLAAAVLVPDPWVVTRRIPVALDALATAFEVELPVT